MSKVTQLVSDKNEKINLRSQGLNSIFLRTIWHHFSSYIISTQYNYLKGKCFLTTSKQFYSHSLHFGAYLFFWNFLLYLKYFIIMGIIQINHKNVLLPKCELPLLHFLLNFYPFCSSQCVSLNQSCEVGIPASWDVTLNTSLISEILS